MSVCLYSCRSYSGMQIASFMQIFILLSVACLVLSCFFIYLINIIFEKKKLIAHEVCVLIFCTSFICNIFNYKNV